MPRTRPQDLGLVTLRLPVGAYASLLHRITGVLLMAVVGWAVVLLRRSLQGPEGFGAVAHGVRGPWGHAIGPLATFVVAQHFYGGIRHLAHDAGWGFGRKRARASAGAVMICAVLTALGALYLWP
ncbi:succinate dehydrogenase, cytochrome b556 subunit [Acidiferrobacter sp.]|uniref:succinate dehydrogenase, cytochrome b556 subunit n=1 Tax=Acidiferrobacter sp. TaxID=1872107 RepID=UPI00261C187D|nr:succinate dehydrogenase, cytochrome b556 subunit [Acidiferrobacter sp.]